MQVLHYVDVNTTTRDYTLSDRVHCEWTAAGNIQGWRATQFVDDGDVERLEQVLAVPGVYSAEIGQLHDPRVVQVHIEPHANWDEVHPRLVAVLTQMTPGRTPDDW